MVGHPGFSSAGRHGDPGGTDEGQVRSYLCYPGRSGPTCATPDRSRNSDRPRSAGYYVGLDGFFEIHEVSVFDNRLGVMHWPDGLGMSEVDLAPQWWEIERAALTSADHGDQLWLGNFFDTHLVRDRDPVWRIRRHRVDSSWVNGTVAATRAPA